MQFCCGVQYYEIKLMLNTYGHLKGEPLIRHTFTAQLHHLFICQWNIELRIQHENNLHVGKTMRNSQPRPIINRKYLKRKFVTEALMELEPDAM